MKKTILVLIVLLLVFLSFPSGIFAGGYLEKAPKLTYDKTTGDICWTWHRALEKNEKFVVYYRLSNVNPWYYGNSITFSFSFKTLCGQIPKEVWEWKEVNSTLRVSVKVVEWDDAVSRESAKITVD